ncbi:YibE/F family protein [Dellaglioa sp. P0083]|uniref:YibE/F family protein n=1 Tax=Dellaglioa kimchii TaxID=3344667 RepID=UPI0038D3674D
MKKLLQKNIILILTIIIGGILVIGVKFDQALYSDTIVKITQVKDEKTEKVTDEFENNDTQTKQKLFGTVMNGKYKGQTIRLPNTYSSSRANDQKYQKNDQVFVTINPHKSGLTGIIDGFKRDVVVAILIWIAISMLVGFMQFSGMIAVLSIVLNMIIFFLAIKFEIFVNITNFFWIFAGIALIFAVLTLSLVIGFNRQMLVTLLATLTGTSLSLIISVIILKLTNDQGMHYEALSYATQAPKELFLAATLLGSLGAVMDESTDIVATLFQLKKEQPTISPRELFKSGREVGQSIMGPLINVLFLIFIADIFPLAVLYFRTTNTIGYTFSWTMALGVVQTLISGIGIVIAIPVASFFASRLIKGDDTL